MNTDNMKRQIQDAFDREDGVRRLVLCCSCFNMEKRAKEAFSVLFPEEIFPETIKGRDRLYKFAKETGNDHILAISKLTGKFAYYVKVKDNKIVEEYNLLTRSRIA